MNVELKNKIDERLQRIANVLILNASFTDNLGLLGGKMGIAIFFYQYSKYVNDSVYNNYADTLIDEIYDDISKILPIDFVSGLSGVAWGIEYLVQNKFVNANTDEALEEVDTSILKYRLSHEVLLQKEDVVFGQGHCLLARLSYNAKQDTDELTHLLKQENLIFLIDECERLIEGKIYTNAGIEFLNLGVINSILFFLLEAIYFQLMTRKIKRLIQHLLIEHIKNNKKIMEEDCLAEKLLLMLLLEKSLSVMSDNSFYVESVKGFLEQNTLIVDEKKLEDKHWLASQFAMVAWHSLVYNLPIADKYNLIEDKSLSVIVDEDWWNERLDQTGLHNISLYNGLAAIGLGLISFSSHSSKA